MTDGKPSKTEHIKENSHFLRGTISEGLVHVETGAIGEDDFQLLKFHGSYMQDDRDVRGERAKKKLDKAYMFMVRLRIPGGPLLATMALGIAAHVAGLSDLLLPHGLLMLAYGMIGLAVGLQFTKAILLTALRNLPAMIVAIGVLVAICAGMGAALVAMTGMDPLTAYLATSPGAIDTIAIVALGSDVDMPTVASLQAARFLAVVLIAPHAARLLARL